MNSEPHVFISFSYIDWDTVSAILEALDRHHIQYWSDQRIAAGDDWKRETDEAIESADVFILMVSPGYASSDFAMYEMGWAVGISRDTGAKIVPVIIKDGLMPSVLKRYQSLDARNMDAEEIAVKIGQLAGQ